MDVKDMQTFELINLIDVPDMPEPLVLEALEELNFREQNTSHEEEIAEMYLYFKNP